MRVCFFIFLSLWMVSRLEANELLFEEAIDKALAASRQVKIARLDSKLASTNTLQSAATMSPQVSLAWINTHYDSAIMVPFNGQNVTIRPQEQSLGSLIVQQPISPIIGLIQKIRADTKTQKAAQAGFELSQVEIAFGGAQAYRQIQQLSELDRIAKGRVELGEKQEHDAAAIFRAGRISKSDLLRVRMALGQAKVGAASVHAQYEAALYAFKDLLGYELDELVELSPLTSPLAPLQQIESGTEKTERLDIKVAKLTQEAAKENSWLSVASFLPNFGAFARIDKNFVDPGGFSVTTVYSIGLNLTWNIWDGGTRFLNLKSASLMTSKAHLNYLTTMRNAAIDQEQKRLDLEAAKESLDLQKTMLEQSEESYRAAFTRFGNGAISVTDLLQSELDLNNAKVGWAKAITDLDIKHMLLQKANGARRPTSLL
ncbi:MAG: TolC family protein [Myxococcaceae bacterium]